jgi:hypothetical protein
LIATDGWLQPIGVLVLFATGELLSNIVIEPLVYGRSIGVSQSALIVAIAFWAWLWGPMGLVLAAPLTVCLVILGKYVPALKFFDILLGDSPVLTTDVRLYQRLLAHDEDGAFQIASTARAENSLIEVYDRLLVPSLHGAKRDYLADRLPWNDAHSVWALVGEIGEELAMSKPLSSADENEVVEAERSEEPIRVRVMACPAKDKADESLLKLIQEAIDTDLIDFQITGSNRLVSEVAVAAEDVQPAIFLITSVPPGGVARARLLCTRLRQKLPELKIVVARCCTDLNAQENQQRMQDSGADFVCDSVAETVEQLTMLSRLLRPARVSGSEVIAGITSRTNSDPKVA